MNQKNKLIPLKELCINYKKDIVDGPFGSNLKRAHFTDKGIPVLKIQNIKPFEIVLKKMDYVAPQKAEELNKHSFRKGDIIVTKLGLPLGISAIVENINKGIIVADLVRVRTDPNKINTKYLCYHLNSTLTNSFLNSQQRGTTRPRIRISVIRELPILTPPLEEQRRIVKILDEAFEGIAIAEANTKKNLANAIELFDSYLNKVFIEKGEDWVEKNLKDIAIEFGRGKSKHRPRNDKKLYGGKYPFIQTGDIRNSNHIVKKYSQTYNENGLAQSKLWSKGTVCITIAANIAETAVLDFDACIPDSIIGIYVDETKANNIFVEYMLQSFKLFLQAQGKGSAQDNINMGTFKNQTFPFPDVNTQRMIASNLDEMSKEVHKLESVYQCKLEALAELRRSILQKAFTGQLTT